MMIQKELKVRRRGCLCPWGWGLRPSWVWVWVWECVACPPRGSETQEKWGRAVPAMSAWVTRPPVQE